MRHAGGHRRLRRAPPRPCRPAAANVEHAVRRFYKLLYRVGLTPWEGLPELPVSGQVSALFDREEADREPPYGQALDLGCGSGIWAVELAKRGWQVTGIDIIPRAVRRARERAREAGVEARFIEGDVSALRVAGVGSGFRLVLDFGTVHGLAPAEREAVGQAVSAVAADDATVLMYAAIPAFRGPLPRGMSRTEIEAAYPGWEIVDEELFDVSEAPGPLQKARPSWYRLRRE
jgi:SAM-dependent methyltransferase